MKSLISRRSRFISRGIRLTSIASRDDGKRSGRHCAGASLILRSSIRRNAPRSLNRLPMTARTDESATYALIRSLRFTANDGDGDGATATATDRSSRPTSSSRTGRKDLTRREVKSSRVQILRSCRHASP